MNKLLKLIKTLKEQGFASKSEKEEVKKLFGELDDEGKEILKSEVESIAKLQEVAEDIDAETKKEMKKVLNYLLDEREESIKSEIKEFLTEQKDLMEKKAGVYQPDIAAKRKNLNSYTRELLKTIITGQESAEFKEFMKKEMSTDASGSPYAGYTVDAELAAEVRHIMTEYGTAIKEFENIQLQKNSYKANELVTDAAVYWVDEAGSISSSQVVLGQNTLELKKMAVIVAWTAELLEDTEIDFISLVASRVAELFAEKEDEAFFNGDGTSTYGGFTGLLNSTYVNSVTITGTTFASVGPDDLLDMIDATPSGATKNAKFYMNRTIFSIIRKKKSSQNEYVFQHPADKGPVTAWGYPVEFVEVMPESGDTAADTPFIIFGDLKKGAIRGYKGGIKVLRADQATIRNVAGNADLNLFTSDRIGIRWTSRVGYIQTIRNNKKPITVLSTSALSA